MNSLWLDFEPKNSSYPSFSEDSNADVCVIGAGIFGLTCAYYLTQLGFHVTVLEKDSIGEKTTGHTTAKITSQHGLFYQYLMDSYGSKFAHDYLEANELAIERIKDIVDNEKIKCDFSCQNNYVYTTKKSELSMIKKEVSCVTSLGFPCEFVTKTGLPFAIEGAACFKNQAQFHPLKYLDGLCNSILSHHGKIYTNSVVHSIENDGLNGYFVSTEQAKLHCQFVIVASHYPFINFPRFLFS